MIKFFRKIRQNLLSEGKTSKYFKYAVGEIILVVIGILIALSINNWNENRKIKIKEIKTLKELRSDLAQNLIDINGNIASLKNCKKSNEIIIHHIENNLPYHDSLNFHFSRLYPYIALSVNQTTYESLKQTGFNLISNDSLRISISDIYANQFSFYQKLESSYLEEHHNNYIKPMFMSEFITFKYLTSLQPKNYAEFVQNEEYKQIMNFTIDICGNFIRFQSGLKLAVEELIKKVDEEIDN